MTKYYIEGGGRLSGELSVHGAKNSVLPILAGALLMQESVIHNCPALTDVSAACNILNYLGCDAKRDGECVATKSDIPLNCDIPDQLMREMRSSVVFLGAIIARCGKATVSLPGGWDCKQDGEKWDRQADAITVKKRKTGGATLEVALPVFGCRF